ncbi:hypothetical protein BN1708_002269 [Verticillium longisporum]|uniref:Uncharacterized protein n=1 Tax=Verticillium longisporum TaxID=100787 RepID=A0A0G4KLK8_VERLO|nr:hypothetical protein BN1708_002269 [Verticillium longisporum]
MRTMPAPPPQARSAIESTASSVPTASLAAGRVVSAYLYMYSWPAASARLSHSKIDRERLINSSVLSLTHFPSEKPEEHMGTDCLAS